MRKFKIFVDMEAEENYLNEMAQKGYLLKKYTDWGCYHFERGNPQNLHYRVDYRLFQNKEEFEEYKTFFLDTGWILVYGTPSSGSLYFLPTDPNASHEFFSDHRSKIARYKRFLVPSIISICLYAAYAFIAVFVMKKEAFQLEWLYIFLKYVVTVGLGILFVIQSTWIIQTIALMKRQS